jgi:hypothetical protein
MDKDNIISQLENEIIILQKQNKDLKNIQRLQEVKHIMKIIKKSCSF